MSVIAEVAVLALALAGRQAADSNFESGDYGIKLTIPPGWSINATRQARVILKLNQAGEGPNKPEMLVYEAPFSEPITLGQYREQLRHFIQRAYKDPVMLDDRAISGGGRTGFLFVLRSKGQGDVELVSLKGILELSPRRMLGVDAVFPKGQEEAQQKAYDALLGSIQFIPRTPPMGTADGLKRFAEVASKVAAAPVLPAHKEELEIVLGEKAIGTYSVSISPAKQGDRQGIASETVFRVDVGDEGRAESKIEGFFTPDLSFQTVRVTELKSGKEKRVQSFEATTTLTGGEFVAERRINGEKSSAKFKVPERTVLSELVEPVQQRLLEAGKGLVSFPAVAAYESEPGWVKVENGGLNKMKVDDQTIDVHVSFLLREDGSLSNYWYDGDRRLLRISQNNQSLVIRRKK